MARKKQFEKEDISDDKEFSERLDEEELAEPLEEVFDGLSSLEEE